MTVEQFGTAPDGAAVERATISGGGLVARIMSWGASVQDLRLEGHAPPLVLGFESFDPYPTRGAHFGAIAGRYANRIAGGRFEIDGTVFELDQNFLGSHTLHGGAQGFSKRVWTIAEASDTRVTLTHRAAAGEMGFPGNLDASCVYEVAPNGRLVIELTATTDAPTLCNLAHHSYFNLEDGGRTDARGHLMQIESDAYLPVDDELIPTGVVEPVAGGAFDFRAARPILGDGAHPGYDHNFCLGSARAPLRRAATARGAKSGVAMEVWTTEPGVQFYDGVNLNPGAPGLEGIVYGAHSGFCLEPQIWPDAPNRPSFPQALLRPEERYAQRTEYRFRRER